MDERELRANLRHLPEARPGGDFTAEVLARVERFERQRTVATGSAAGGWPFRAHRRPAWLAAALAALVLAAAGLWQAPGDGWWRRTAAGGAEDRRPAAGERTGRGGGGSSTAPTSGRDSHGVESRVAARELASDGAGSATIPSGAAAWVGDERRPLEEVASGGAHATTPSVDRPRLAALPALTEAEPPAAPGFPPEALSAPPAPPARRAETSSPGTAAQRLAWLAAERARLEVRLAAFRRELPSAEPPVVLLGGDDRLELVFDLGRWAARPPSGGIPSGVQPAVHSTERPPQRF